MHIQINWASPSTDYDMYVHKGSLERDRSWRPQARADPRRSRWISIRAGAASARAILSSTSSISRRRPPINTRAPQRLATAAPLARAGASRQADSPPRFENYTPPAAGPTTLGRSSGEPSIGVGLPIAGHPEGRAHVSSRCANPSRHLQRRLRHSARTLGKQAGAYFSGRFRSHPVHRFHDRAAPSCTCCPSQPM